MSGPIIYTWIGDAFVPYGSIWARKCDERFVVGERYALDEIHARSSAAHAHYFAVLNQIWQSLPDTLTAEYPTAEHLRKKALIRTGFFTQVQHVCGTKAEADRLRAVIRTYDDYQIVDVTGTVVSVFHAISQDHRHMDKKQFQDSKEKVLQWCADLVDATVAQASQIASGPQ